MRIKQLLQQIYKQKNVINGTKIASTILKETRKKIKQIQKQNTSLNPPKIGIILVGDSPGSLSYIRIKRKACQRVGIEQELCHFPTNVQSQAYFNKLEEFNNRADIHSILTQFPLPDCISKQEVIDSINPLKDVDCLQNSAHIQQIQLDFKNNDQLPCTASAIVHILDFHKVDVKSKQITLIGKSLLVGIPLSFILLQKGAIIQFCDINNDIQHSIKHADIVITAVGKRELVKGEWIKEGAVIIDVGCTKGIRKIDKRRVVGDVQFETAAKRASLINYVPGGVGPITVSMLVSNISKNWEQQKQL